MYCKLWKRIFDITISLIAIVVLSPVLLIVWLLVRLKLGAPAIFRQKRPGKDEKIFTLYKFRSMTDERGEDGELLPDEIRLTSFGKLLRATSLDELPELFNILKGDMSIVGPRPLAVVYLDYYTEEEKRRHSVRPGLTGLAQVNGRNAISWEKKFEYDLQYIDEMSLKSDIAIIFKTFGKVLKREAIGQAEQAPESLHVLRQKEIMLADESQKGVQ